MLSPDGADCGEEAVSDVDTVVEQGNALRDRYMERGGEPDNCELPSGMLLWGLLRAIAECPRCPGVFRNPYHAGGTPGTMDDWGEYLVCPKCGGVWKWQEPEPEKPMGKKRKGRRP